MITITHSQLALSSVAAALIIGASALSAHGIDNDFSWVNSAKGKVLANAVGMTLYTFDKDTTGKSNCYNQCAALWPPALVSPHAISSEPFSVVERDDGYRQWAYQGKPLYTWVKDAQTGDISGDGVKGVWHIVTSNSGY